MADNTDSKLEPGEAKSLRHALQSEMTSIQHDKLESLTSINSIVFGLSTPGQNLWRRVNDGMDHVNATLDSVHKALGNYHDAFAHAEKHMNETQDQATEDAKRLTAGVGLVNKPFYENKPPKHGKPTHK